MRLNELPRCKHTRYLKKISKYITYAASSGELNPKRLNPESTLPWSTPWRTLTIGSLKTITESTMGTDLASPSKLENTDYIESGLASWSWVLLKDESVNYETTKKFIDYASQMEWKYCLIDADWDRRIGYDKVKQLVDYAKEKNVKILVWYNSAGSWNTTPYTPKSKLLTAEDREKEFNKLKEIGVAGIKVDFSVSYTHLRAHETDSYLV